ncbi:uncharacterized protein LOC141697532 [Apium graveolens]|uniref:uncharacterized protein LOC141697532 n=1 Tax=Apium graveolens TaxID=4045 RepID=UPI003D78CC54
MQVNSSKVDEIVMLLWAIWLARNRVIWHNTYPHVDEVVRDSRVILDQWKDAQSKIYKPSVGDSNTMDGKEQWIKPSVDTIKINVDAALFHNEHRYGYGVVARDHNGNFLEVKVAGFAGSMTAEMAEVLGFKEALSWVKAKQWSKVILEMDCIRVVQAMRSVTVFASTFGLIIEDCKKLVHEIANAEYYFVKRSSNRVAYCLARQSCFISDCHFTIHNAPSEVLSLCTADVLV